jgi:hypothetical protein
MTELRDIWNALNGEQKRLYCEAWNGGLSRHGDVAVSRERLLFVWRTVVGDQDPEEVAAFLDEVCGPSD